MEEKLTKQLEDLKSHIESRINKEREAVTESAKAEVREELKSLKDAYGDALEKQGLTLKEVKEELNEVHTLYKKSIDFKDEKAVKTISGMAEKAAENLVKSSQKTWIPFMDTKAAADMTLGNFSGDPSLQFLNRGIEILPEIRHVRSLLNVGTMSAEKFRYQQETANDGTPAMKAEGAAYNQVDNDFTTVDAPAERLGALYVTSKGSLMDVSWLSGFLQRRGIERVVQVEDTQLLTGNGSTPNLTGLNQNPLSDHVDSTAYTLDTALTPNKMDALMFAVLKLLANNVKANGILISPQDYAFIYTARATDGQYLSQLQFSGNQAFIMGVPVYVSNAVASDKFYVGDWNEAEILQREGLSVSFSEEDGNNFQSDEVTIKIGERLAFPIYRPTSFLYGDFSDVIGSLST